MITDNSKITSNNSSTQDPSTGQQVSETILNQIIVEKEGQITTPHPQKSRPMKLLMVVIGFSIAVVLVIVGMNMANRTKTNMIPNNTGDITFIKTDPAKDVVQRSDDTLDLSDQINPEQDLRAQQLSAQIGQQMNFSDGVSMMVTDVDKAWVSNSVRPATGDRFVAVHVTVGNRTKTRSEAFDPHTISVKDSVGTTYSVNDAATATVNYQKDISAVVLQPAEQRDILLIFSVPRTKNDISAVYQARYYQIQAEGDKEAPLLQISGAVKL